VPADHVSGGNPKRGKTRDRGCVHLPLIVELAPSEGLSTSQGGVDAKLSEAQRQLAPLGGLECSHRCGLAEKRKTKGQTKSVSLKMVESTTKGGGGLVKLCHQNRPYQHQPLWGTGPSPRSSHRELHSHPGQVQGYLGTCPQGSSGVLGPAGPSTSQPRPGFSSGRRAQAGAAHWCRVALLLASAFYII